MTENIPVDLKKDHVGGGFAWEIEPNCSCGKVKKAVEDRFLFDIPLPLWMGIDASDLLKTLKSLPV